jgi:hypothetical protein
VAKPVDYNGCSQRSEKLLPTCAYEMSAEKIELGIHVAFRKTILGLFHFQITGWCNYDDNIGIVLGMGSQIITNPLMRT